MVEQAPLKRKVIGSSPIWPTLLLFAAWAQAAGPVEIPPGTAARVELTLVKPSGRLSGRARLEMTLRSLSVDGSTLPVQTDSLSYMGDKRSGKNFGSWLGGALQGALYGVLFGGKGGAVIGAGAGAGAGAASGLFKGKQDLDFPQGAKLMFESTAPVSVPAGLAPPKEEPKPEEKKPEPGKPTT